MRKLTIVLTMVIGIAISGTARATLFDRGSGLIYDDVLDITWLQNANLANRTFTWSGAVNWADALSFGGFSDWRLASEAVSFGLPTGIAPGTANCSVATEVACRDNELGYMYWHNLAGAGANLTGNQTVGGVTLNNIQSAYWSGTLFLFGANAAFYNQFSNGQQLIGNTGVGRSAWAVRDGDVSVPIPEPSTMLLLASGLIGLGFFRRSLKMVR